MGDTGNIPSAALATTGIGTLADIDGTLSPIVGDVQDVYQIHIDKAVEYFQLPPLAVWQV
jgi:hypothetical protein